MNTIELIGLLESPHFADRTHGVEILRSVKDLANLQTLYAAIEERDNDLLRLELLRLAYALLRSEDPKMIGLSLGISLKYATLTRKTIRREADKLIEGFLATAEVNQHLKLLGIRNSWKNANLEERKIATRKIGTYQLDGALPLLLDNFEEQDVELRLLTIKIFGKLKDRRANPELRKILRSVTDPRLTDAALTVLSKHGNFFDRKLFYRWMEAEGSLGLSALAGATDLLGDRAVTFLAAIYRRTKSLPERELIIGFIARDPTPKRVTLLLELLAGEESPQILQKIEWSLGEIDTVKKLDPILRFYPKASDPVKFRIIVLLDEIYHPRCYEFYREILRKNESAFLTMAALDAIAHYNDDRSLPLIAEFLKNPDDPVHYYALAAYVKHSRGNLRTVIEAVVDLNLPDERHHHQLLLDVLKEHKALESLELYLQTYIIRMMNSKLSQNRYLAYAVVGKYFHDFELRGIFDQAIQEKNIIVRKEAFKVFATIFSDFPTTFLLEKPPAEIIHETLFMDHLIIRADMLLSLINASEWAIISRLQTKSPLQFRRIFIEIAEVVRLNGEVFAQINLSLFNLEELNLLLKNHGDDLSRKYLYGELARRPGTDPGEILLSHYLKLNHRDAGPFLQKFFGGHP